MQNTVQRSGDGCVADPDKHHHAARGARLRTVEPGDGAAIWRMVREAGELEVNTAYCYVLLCTHFDDTCLIAEDGDGRPLGFVVAYRPPRQMNTIFVWQVGVLPAARGAGLGRRLLRELVERAAVLDVRYLEASVTPGNAPSRALFRSLARELGADCAVGPFMGADFFPGEHEPEELFRIGPITIAPAASAGSRAEVDSTTNHPSGS